MQSSRAAFIAALFFCAIVLIVLLVPLPDGQWVRQAPALFGEIENLGHPVVFALLARLALGFTPRIGLVSGALLLFGGGTELLQHFTGRDASLQDLLANALGVAFALTLDARWRLPRLRAWVAGAIAALCLLPLLWTTAAYVHRHLDAPVIWRENSALHGRFSRWQQGEYPGLEIGEPIPDWRGYRELQVAMTNPDTTEARVIVRAHDWNHDQQYSDRFNRIFLIPAGREVLLRIPLEQIAAAPATRKMDLATMSSVIIFQSNADQAFRPRISLVRLAR